MSNNWREKVHSGTRNTPRAAFSGGRSQCPALYHVPACDSLGCHLLPLYPPSPRSVTAICQEQSAPRMFWVSAFPRNSRSARCAALAQAPPVVAKPPTLPGDHGAAGRMLERLASWIRGGRATPRPSDRLDTAVSGGMKYFLPE
jgi:hypothetical protein